MGKRKPVQPRVVIIGVGNDFRRDDGVGLAVVRRLRGKVNQSVQIIEESGEGTALLQAWEDADRAVIVDAVHSGALPGTFFRFEAGQQKLPAGLFTCSTHLFSVMQVTELARKLDLLPPRLTIWGIEGKDFSLGRGLSWEVESKIDEVVNRVMADLGPCP